MKPDTTDMAPRRGPRGPKLEGEDVERALALEAWVKTLDVNGQRQNSWDGVLGVPRPHPIDKVLVTGGVAAAGLVLRTARAIVGNDDGKVFGDEFGDAWTEARSLAREFSEASYKRWPVCRVPSALEAMAAVEILLYCAACCESSKQRGEHIKRLLELPPTMQSHLMDAERRRQKVAGRPLQGGSGASTRAFGAEATAEAPTSSRARLRDSRTFCRR